MLALYLVSRWPQVALFSEVTSYLPLRSLLIPLLHTPPRLLLVCWALGNHIHTLLV